MYKQKFHDINKFPKDWGVIVFPISMSNTTTIQSADKCVEALDFFLDKILVNKVGANFIYSEGLYMNFETDPFETKNSFAQASVSHMRAVKNLVRKNHQRFQIESAFNFESWFQMYLTHKDFISTFKEIQRFYKSDAGFQEQIKLDADEQGRDLTERQVAFYLEEHTFAYLLFNREFELRNSFVDAREQWILDVYPGKSPRGQIYLVQKDPLGLNEDSNPYKGQYDLIEKKFIPYLEVDLNIY